MSCSYCKNPQVVAKGLCRACYYRQKRTGSLELKPRKKQPLHCTFEGCRNITVARGLCEAHYRTVLKHGDVISPFGYGERRKHPFYEMWRYQSRVKEGRVKEWDDFWQFVADVGERPSERDIARRLDESKPWGPDNFRWAHREAGAANVNEYARRWRARNPLRSKNHTLLRTYGITLEKYTAMYSEQQGRCAICGSFGAPFDSANGRTKTLVVDHHHGSKAIRSLLCTNCNKGIGCMKESVDVLEKAIAYLLTHRR